MLRIQVKAPQKDWTAQGPDLLRTRDSARKAFSGFLEGSKSYNWSKEGADGYGAWKGPLTKAEVMDKFDAWAADPSFDKQRVKVATVSGQDVCAARANEIRVQTHEGATKDADNTWALADRAFPKTQFGGIYNCRKVSGSSTWSQHAWGDAVDISHGDTAAVFDWCIRMAKDKLLVASQIIGTADGKDENQSRQTKYAIEPYNGDGSHTWHVHVSCHDHSGTPPCA